MPVHLIESASSCHRKSPKLQDTVRLFDFHAAHRELRKRLFEVVFHVSDIDELRAVMSGIDEGQSLGIGIDRCVIIEVSCDQHVRPGFNRSTDFALS